MNSALRMLFAAMMRARCVGWLRIWISAYIGTLYRPAKSESSARSAITRQCAAMPMNWASVSPSAGGSPREAKYRSMAKTLMPIAPRSEDPQAYEAAFDAAAKVLAEGDLLAIFPEGGITVDGTLQEFKGGIMKILERQPVPVIPMALTNLWGSYFSRIEKEGAMVRPFRRGLFSRVGLNVGAPEAPEQVSPQGLRDRVGTLLSA